jgi:hypothetical protein
VKPATALAWHRQGFAVKVDEWQSLSQDDSSCQEESADRSNSRRFWAKRFYSRWEVRNDDMRNAVGAILLVLPLETPLPAWPLFLISPDTDLACSPNTSPRDSFPAEGIGALIRACNRCLASSERSAESSRAAGTDSNDRAGRAPSRAS